jgi:hypothetical protein
MKSAPAYPSVGWKQPPTLSLCGTSPKLELL